MCRPLDDCLVGLREYIEGMKEEGADGVEAMDYALEYVEEHYHPNDELGLGIVMNVYYG